jgi:hypothetical protein
MSAQSISAKHYIDTERLDQLLPTCDLWIQVGASRITLLAADRFNTRVAGLSVIDFGNQSVFESTWPQLASALQQSTLYGYDYQNVHLAFTHPVCTLVPQALHSETQNKQVLTLLHQLPASWLVMSRAVSHKPWVTVFAAPELLVRSMQQQFPQSAPEHSSTALLHALQLDNGKNTNRLYAYINAQYLHIVRFAGSDLQFSNTYLPEADTDIVYFLLSVAEQQKVNADKLEVCLVGEVNARSSMVALLRKYIPQVLFFERNSSFQYPASFKEFPDYQYIDALAVLWFE